MRKVPTTLEQYEEIVAHLYREFPTLLSWESGVYNLRFYASFTIDPWWFPAVWQLLENLASLDAMNLIDPPIFRDFKDKRGLLCIYFDGGDELSEMLIEGVEKLINRR
ncbi:hypothetical protein [Alcanivorax sp. NBRC 102024]|jgi:hypothetical protein|uniref:hypothetical protein n=1 Tax=Alcanivorax sp. NBRC 102024 TaxID=1113895 RepID=UPI000789C94D|nr:hypothetical protein [Alcanivorax sp. NBRC 102024]